MVEFLQACFAWPAVPATILLIIVMLYWFCVMLGALDIDFLDLDLDMDGDADSFTSIGFMPLKFLNFGRVPLMLWVSIFALAMWVLAWVNYSQLLIGRPVFENDIVNHAWKFAVDLLLGLGLTKMITQPLRGKLDTKPPNPIKEIVGKTCVISTEEVTQSAGQGRLATGGAPLVLNVRTADGTLSKGDTAEIIEFRPEQNIYIVQKANSEE